MLRVLYNTPRKMRNAYRPKSPEASCTLTITAQTREYSVRRI
jgi:hypothetical protein